MDDRARAADKPLAEVALADRFDLSKSRVLLTGAQAIPACCCRRRRATAAPD